jgi:L-ascorbate metabolism protein UlaG (beta-lactamase superfamily)
MQKEIGSIDVLLVPVGGNFTISPEQAVKITTTLDPSYVIPMHYRTDEHHSDTFGMLKTVEGFLNEYGVQKKAVKSLDVDAGRLPEETEVVVLERV